MLAYRIPYSHKLGSYVSSKLAESPEEALKLVQAVHKKTGMSGAPNLGAIEYGTPYPADPQPFGWTASEVQPARRKQGGTGAEPLLAAAA